MKKIFKLAFFSSVFASLIGCQTISTVVSGPHYESFDGIYAKQESVVELLNEEERYAGKSVVSELSFAERPDIYLDSGHIVKSTRVTKYLQAILKRVIDKNELALHGVSVKLVDKPIYYASINPFKEVSISPRVIMIAETEDEIAFILAHELSHLLLSHHRSILQEEDTVDMIENVNMAYGVFTQLKGLSGSRFMSADISDSTRRDLTKVDVTKRLMEGLTEDVWGGMWKRDQEDEADLLGLDLMIKAGYSHQGALMAFKHIQLDESNKKTQLELLHEQHEQAMLNLEKSGDIRNIFGTGMVMFKDAAFTFYKDLIKKVATGHNSPEIRRENTLAYFDREYRAVKENGRPLQYRAITSAQLKNLQQSRTFKNTLKSVELSQQVLMMLAQKDTKSAERLAKQAVQLSGSSPHSRYALFKVREAQNNQRYALANIKYIKPQNLVSKEFYEYEINYWLSKGNSTKALSVIEGARSKLNSRDSFVLNEIQALVNNGDRTAARNVYRDCLESRYVKKSCKAKFGNEFKGELVAK